MKYRAIKTIALLGWIIIALWALYLAYENCKFTYKYFENIRIQELNK